MNIPYSKVCSQCKQEFPLTDDYWYKDNRHKDGYHSCCKRCHNKGTTENYRNNGDRINANRRQKRHENPDEYRKKEREWRVAHPDDLRIYRERYKEKYPEKKREHRIRWKLNNPEKNREIKIKWIGNNRDKVRMYARNWVNRNPKTVLRNTHIRRARYKNADGSYTLEEIQQLFEFQNGKCFHCQCDINSYYEIDHWIPLSRGGSNWINNIRLLCKFCNRSKGNKLPHEWDIRYLPE